MAQDLKRVRGFPDHSHEDVLKHDAIIDKALEIAKRFNFQKIDLPILEHTEVFKRTLGATSDIVNKEMYTFQKGEESFTLRPEGTASVARRFITEKLKMHLPIRWIYHGPMFRHERPQKGRFRQFQTVAVELLGEAGEDAGIEIISLAYLFLKELGLEKQTYLEINSIGSSKIRDIYKKNLKEYLKKFYKDLSSDSQVRFNKNPLRIWDSKEKRDQEIMKQAPIITDFLDDSSLKSYQLIQEQLKNLNIPFKKTPQLVRGLDYYNHLVFEFKSQDLGAQSAVLAGGRYDGLIKTLGGLETPAVGWGAGIERLALLSSLTPSPSSPQIGLIALGESAKREMHKLAFHLREHGYRIFYKFTGNLSKQMAKINKHSCSQGLILGDKELKESCIVFKDMNTKEQKSISYKTYKELIDKLKNI